MVPPVLGFILASSGWLKMFQYWLARWGKCSILGGTMVQMFNIGWDDGANVQ
jgi:hypothetical protein